MGRCSRFQLLEARQDFARNIIFIRNYLPLRLALEDDEKNMRASLLVDTAREEAAVHRQNLASDE
jgi:hypothetical protein